MSRPGGAGGSHRDTLLREGWDQLFEHGFHGMSVDGVLAATGVPKGSFYHQFDSKTAFAAAVLERYGRFHQERLADWAGRSDLTTGARLAGYYTELAALVVAADYRRGDLAGKLATEVSTSTPLLRDRIAALTRSWLAQLQEVLTDGQERGDVRRDRPAADLAAVVLALADGAFVVAASTRDDEALAAVGRSIELLVAAPGTGR